MADVGIGGVLLAVGSAAIGGLGTFVFQQRSAFIGRRSAAAATYRNALNTAVGDIPYQVKKVVHVGVIMSPEGFPDPFVGLRRSVEIAVGNYRPLVPLKEHAAMDAALASFVAVCTAAGKKHAAFSPYATVPEHWHLDLRAQAVDAVGKLLTFGKEPPWWGFG